LGPPGFGSDLHWPTLLLALTVATGAGLWDDLRGLSVSGKLLAQSSAAVLALLAGASPSGTGGEALGAVLAFVWIVVVTNAFNLLDNMDGLAAGTAAVAAVCWACFGWLGGSPSLTVLGMILLGASLGFLPFNLPRARLFMGDAGSQGLGLWCAVATLDLQRSGLTSLAMASLVGMLILALPLFDTFLVIVSRLRRGKNPLTTPGMDHLSHRLLRAGFSTVAVLVLLWGLAAVSGALAVLLGLWGTLWLSVSATVIAGLGALVALVWLEHPRWLDQSG
jgi:UDP-GlcNAc:undecaprenyl-phosphate/decaprenyl-phosphate GlcNAc-1-phosphate transferase